MSGGEKGFVLPDELIHSESKQIQVSSASLKPQRRLELKTAVYNKLPMDFFLAPFFLLTLRKGTQSFYICMGLIFVEKMSTGSPSKNIF